MDRGGRILCKATDGGVDRDRATFETWGGPLTLECYLAAVGRLRRHPWSQAVSDVWLLRSGEGEVLSSFEVYRMPSRLREDACGQGLDGSAYAIGNMFTEAHLRGKGYATEILLRFKEHIPTVDPRAQALVLYSDVPTKIYEKSGFVARPALSLLFDALPGDPAEGVELLKEDCVAPALAGLPCPAGGFTVLPEPGQLDWHLERDWIFSELLGRPRPAACGARLGDGLGQDGLILWCANFVKEQLEILLLHAPGSAQAEALLRCARREAKASGFAGVALWQTPADPPMDEGVVLDRLGVLDSVPMILPLAAGVDPEAWNWIPKAIWV